MQVTVVLDTNIWISGLILPKSKAGIVLGEWRKSKFEIVMSQPIIDEIERVVAYPKIRKRLKSNEEIKDYLEILRFRVDLVALDSVDPKVVVDKDHSDSPILKTLIASKANYLVTGDKDLLAYKEHHPILTLSEFYELI